MSIEKKIPQQGSTEIPPIAPNFRTGTLAIIGRPNVGKSTLLNRLIGEKISIVSSKPQTTRHTIRGILTRADTQYIFVDTPGFQSQCGNALHRWMNRSVTSVLASVDVVILVIEARRWHALDQRIVHLLPTNRPVLLAINKIDQLSNKAALLPLIDTSAKTYPFADIVPVCAKRAEGLEDLLTTAARYLPIGDPLFDADQITDRSERFLAAEFLREKLFRHLGQEVPYGLTVEVERFIVEGGLRRISLCIFVESESHKGIVIGEQGHRLKTINTQARRAIEQLFGGKVFLEVWVKVKEGWADNARALKSLGYS